MTYILDHNDWQNGAEDLVLHALGGELGTNNSRFDEFGSNVVLATDQDLDGAVLKKSKFGERIEQEQSEQIKL